jgi:outer membrane protein assembly factor BamA
VQARSSRRATSSAKGEPPLGYQRGRRTNFFSISYADPWFLDTPNSLGISVYNRATVYPASFGYEYAAKAARSRTAIACAGSTVSR